MVMREFHMIVKSANGAVYHRKLDVNDGITLASTDVIIYQEMVDVNIPTTAALEVLADGTAEQQTT